MINGRNGENDFTNINGNGKSVVDYIIVPHEQLDKYRNFKVHTMSTLINRVNMQGHLRSSEHSVLQVTLQTEIAMRSVSSADSPTTRDRYKLNDITASFLNCESSFQQLMDTIHRIEQCLLEERDVQLAYTEFVDLIKREMDTKLPKRKQSKPGTSHNPHKSRAKPYWTSELQALWDDVCKTERLWLNNKRGVNGSSLKEDFRVSRKKFDKLNRQCKRKYLLDQQKQLQEDFENYDNPRNFWSKIGRLGLANDRKTSIPWEVKDCNGQIYTDRNTVLHKWKTDYECLFNAGQDNPHFDKTHLENVIKINRDPGTASFPTLDCSILNCPISREEVRMSVYKARARKAPGADEIPSEVLRNDSCIDILFRIIKYCFDDGRVPNEWTKGIINPIFKGDDPSNPLNYRPITLLSVPCKIYTDILNRRFTQWLEANYVLYDGQNGFRKGRSCLDHIYTLYTVINNRKLDNKDTFVCFVDAKKAFDTVNRDCLWYKLMSIGINGKFLNAVQSLYDNVSCTVRVNNCETDWFSVTQGVKQGCVISPTLFSIYVNDLAVELDNLNCGVSLQETLNISVLLYADDIAILSETEAGMQTMLNKLDDWCRKWRITVNETKTKVLHFRPKARIATDIIFKCGNQKIDVDSSYKYLGFWMNEFLDMKFSIREIAKSASRALGAIYSKFLCAGGMNISVYTKLVETMVEPVLFFCSGIWGHTNFSEIESVLNKAGRYFLGVTKHCSNVSSRGDLGWNSCEVKQRVETVRLWCRLKNMPEHRIIRRIHERSLPKSRTWERKMQKFSETHNIEELMLTENPNKTVCISTVRDILTEKDNTKWYQKLMSNGNAENGNKLRTYRQYKSVFKTEHYVKCNMDRGHRRVLAKFRSCNLPLAIETGRYNRPKTPVSERLCNYCHMDSIEDETHFLVDCEFYSDLRFNLFQSAQNINDRFKYYESIDKLIWLMNCNDLQFQLAKVLFKMNKRRFLVT